MTYAEIVSAAKVELSFFGVDVEVSPHPDFMQDMELRDWYNDYVGADDANEIYNRLTHATLVS